MQGGCFHFLWGIITHFIILTRNFFKGITLPLSCRGFLGYNNTPLFLKHFVQQEFLLLLPKTNILHPPHPQPLPFSSLSLKTPAKTVPPTPGTASQQKIESNLEKSLGNTLNIHLQQQMGSFQASMVEAFQSLQDELTSKNRQRWVRPRPQLLSLELHLVLFTWTYPLRDLELPLKPRIWIWTMVQHFLHISDLIFRMHQIRILMHPRNQRSQIDLKNTLTLTKGMKFIRGLPRMIL